MILALMKALVFVGIVSSDIQIAKQCESDDDSFEDILLESNDGDLESERRSKKKRNRGDDDQENHSKKMSKSLMEAKTSWKIISPNISLDEENLNELKRNRDKNEQKKDNDTGEEEVRVKPSTTRNKNQM